MDEENDIQEKISQLITATGALAELLYTFYSQLFNAGFTSEAALALTSKLMMSSLGMGEK